MVILILFHSGGFRCFKHYYKEYVCKHLKHLFPRQVSYNRFVELEKEVLLPLTIFIKKREFEIKLKNSQLPVIDKFYINGGFLLKLPLIQTYGKSAEKRPNFNRYFLLPDYSITSKTPNTL